MDVDLATISLIHDLAELDRTKRADDRQKLIRSALASLTLLERAGGGSLGLARVRSLSDALHAERRDP